MHYSTQNFIQSVSPHILIPISQRRKTFPFSWNTVHCSEVFLLYLAVKNIYCTVWKLLCKTLYHAAGIYAVC
jgi:hypothetical protein